MGARAERERGDERVIAVVAIRSVENVWLAAAISLLVFAVSVVILLKQIWRRS